MRSLIKHSEILLFMVLFFVPVLLVTGQTKYSLPDGEDYADITVSSGDIAGRYGISSFSYEEVENISGKYLKLSVPGAFPSGIPGTPQLPVFSELVEADTAFNYKLVIHSLDSVVIELNVEFTGYQIFPAQAPVQKGIDTSHPSFIGYPALNQQASGEQQSMISLEQEGTMRGVAIARIQFNPFHLDPDHNLLTIYHNIDFSLIPTDYQFESTEISSEPFRRAISSIVRNDEQGSLKRLVKDEPVTMVILSDTLFRNSLQPLIQWKKEKGIRIIEAYTTDPQVGSTYQEIRNFMFNMYTNPPAGYAPPSYLLIAGDVEHVPVSQPSGQITDLYYTTFDGAGDYLPEIFHGRISVKNDTQLTNVIDKILMYEKYDFPDPSFLNRTILIAGYDGSYGPVHGNGQINYAANYYFNEGNGIDAGVYLHPEASNLDHQIRVDISEGAALVNYTGHGEYYGWLDPSFRLQHLDTMKNYFKYPLMIGNGCKTNQFNLSGTDCFAEAILKLKDRGAVGYIGGTNDSYWDEDYYWSVGVGPITSQPDYNSTTFGYYDKLFHLGKEPVEEWSPSFGEMIFAGNMTVQQSTSTKKKYYWEIYQIMGDPSLVPWFREPANLPVDFPVNIPLDATQVSIRASAYDYIAISAHGTLIDAMHADKFGQAYLEIPASLEEGNLTLVVTGDHRQPFMDTIYRGSSRRGYIELAEYMLNQESVSMDQQISQGEHFSLNLQLVNKSDRLFHSSELVLRCHDDFVMILDSLAVTGVINPGDSITLNNVFRVGVNDSLADMTPFTLAIHKSSNDQGNVLYLKEVVHSAALSSKGITWEDRTHGNGNRIIEPGEQLLFSWNIKNSGSYRSDSLKIAPNTGTEMLFSGFSSVNFAGIQPGETKALQFKAEIQNTQSLPAAYRLKLSVSNRAEDISDSVFIAFNKHYEDFSTGDLSSFDWKSSAVSWRPDSLVFSGAPYSLRSGNISHSASTSVLIEFETKVVDSVVFDYNVSSEYGYDFFKFFVDSGLVGNWSGETGWQQFTHQLQPGKHQLEWRYQKDSNTIGGKDAAWIDNIVFPANLFDSLDMAVLKLNLPITGKSLGGDEIVKIEVMNSGKDTVAGFTAAYKFGNSQWLEYEHPELVLPGQNIEIMFPGTINMQGIETYGITVAIRADGDAFPGNDTVLFMVDHYAFPDLSLEHAGMDSISGIYTNLMALVANEGNNFIENFNYTILLDNEFLRSGVTSINLEPGQVTELSIPLIRENDKNIDFGWHDYEIFSKPDSVDANNRLNGTIFWNVQSIHHEGQESVRIYPNPVNGYFWIEIPPATQKPVTVGFYTLDGKKIISDVIHSDKQQFNTAIFKSEGIYIVTISSGKGNIISNGKIRISK
ncbi:MAG: C25 family cysteine peptidase [Bacteroidales bacterium]